MSLVIKLGGSVLTDEARRVSFAKQIAQINDEEDELVIVHGGGPAIGEELNKLKIPFEFVNGVRKTTPEMMPAVEMALWERINAELSEALASAGVAHRRLCGAKDQVLLAKVFDESLGLVGDVVHVGFSWRDLLEPILLCPIGFDEQGRKLNINADFAAQAVATHLIADKLIFLSDQEGLLNGEGKLLETVDDDLAQKLISDGVVTGGMRAKVDQIFRALGEGVGRVHLLDGRSDTALADLILEQKSSGTTFCP